MTLDQRVAFLDANPTMHASQRVVSFKQIGWLHNKPVASVARMFRKRRDYFTPNEDFFVVGADSSETDRGSASVRDDRGRLQGRPDRIVLTESGYALLSKVFSDDTSWQVMKKLVRGYFRAREAFSRIPADAVLVSRSDLNAIMEKQEELVRAVKVATSNGARQLRAWQSLGPATKALADEPKGQGYIVGVERLNILADIAKAGTPEGREKRLGELLAQVVGLVLGAEGAA